MKKKATERGIHRQRRTERVVQGFLHKKRDSNGMREKLGGKKGITKGG